MVLCTDVIEHVQYPDKTLGEIQRILKPDGELIISTPILLNKTFVAEEHVLEWDQEAFRALCLSTFSECKKQVISHPVFWFEIFRKRYLRQAINFLAKYFKNVFYSGGKSSWVYNKMQTLVLKK